MSACACLLAHANGARTIGNYGNGSPFLATYLVSNPTADFVPLCDSCKLENASNSQRVPEDTTVAKCQASCFASSTCRAIGFGNGECYHNSVDDELKYVPDSSFAAYVDQSHVPSDLPYQNEAPGDTRVAAYPSALPVDLLTMVGDPQNDRVAKYALENGWDINTYQNNSNQDYVDTTLRQMDFEL